MLNFTCYTIGHSNISSDQFIELLKNYKIDCLVDARSIPYSKYATQFNKENINNELIKNHIKYIFMGNLIGEKIDDAEYLINEKVDYTKLREKPEFQEGIERIIDGIKKDYKIAIMCSEKEPAHCHRYHSISKELKKSGVFVIHILQDGKTLDQDEMEEEERLQERKKPLPLF